MKSPIFKFVKGTTNLMKNDGKIFERLCSELITIMSSSEKYTSVEGPRVLLSGHDGEREFDIVLRSKVSSINLLTVIECRDHQSKLDVTHIDGFHSKMQDVGANKGIIISPIGFTSTAVSKAKRLGVTLLTCLHGERFSDSVVDMGLDVPFIVTELVLNAALSGGTIEFKKETIVSDEQWGYLNGKPLYQYALEALSDISDTDIEVNQEIVIQLRGSLSKDWILDDSNNRIPIADPDIIFEVSKIQYYFGYLSGIEDVKIMSDIISGERTLFLNPLEFFSGTYQSKFTKYNILSEIPEVNAARARIYKPGGFDFPDFIHKIKNGEGSL